MGYDYVMDEEWEVRKRRSTESESSPNTERGGELENQCNTENHITGAEILLSALQYGPGFSGSYKCSACGKTILAIINGRPFLPYEFVNFKSDKHEAAKEG